jgi:hypothetical protein
MIVWIVALLVGFGAAAFGGVAGGLLVGAKDLGAELAAYMGGFYGTLAGFAGVLAGLGLLAWVIR